MFLCHLMKFHSPKMHVNTKFVFLLLTTKWPTNVINYVVVIRESKSSKLTFISQHVNVPAADTYTCCQTVAPLVSRSVDISDTLFNVMPTLPQVFRFIHDLLHWSHQVLLSFVLLSGLFDGCWSGEMKSGINSLEPGVLEHCPTATWINTRLMAWQQMLFQKSDI